jgi:hypothetical protein
MLRVARRAHLRLLSMTLRAQNVRCDAKTRRRSHARGNLPTVAQLTTRCRVRLSRAGAAQREERT